MEVAVQKYIDASLQKHFDISAQKYTDGSYTIFFQQNALVSEKHKILQFVLICLCILSPYMFRPTWDIFRGRNASA
jgi:hypothetical protein